MAEATVKPTRGPAFVGRSLPLLFLSLLPLSARASVYIHPPYSGMASSASSSSSDDDPEESVIRYDSQPAGFGVPLNRFGLFEANLFLPPRERGPELDPFMCGDSPRGGRGRKRARRRGAGDGNGDRSLGWADGDDRLGEEDDDAIESLRLGPLTVIDVRAIAAGSDVEQEYEDFGATSRREVHRGRLRARRRGQEGNGGKVNVFANESAETEETLITEDYPSPNSANADAEEGVADVGDEEDMASSTTVVPLSDLSTGAASAPAGNDNSTVTPESEEEVAHVSKENETTSSTTAVLTTAQTTALASSATDSPMKDTTTASTAGEENSTMTLDAEEGVAPVLEENKTTSFTTNAPKMTQNTNNDNATVTPPSEAVPEGEGEEEPVFSDEPLPGDFDGNYGRRARPIALLVRRGGCTFGQKARSAMALNGRLQEEALAQLAAEAARTMPPPPTASPTGAPTLAAGKNMTDEGTGASLSPLGDLSQRPQQPPQPRLLEIRYVLVMDSEPEPSSTSGSDLVLMDGPKEGIDVSLLFLSYNSGRDLLGRMARWDQRVGEAAGGLQNSDSGNGTPPPYAYFLTPADLIPSRVSDPRSGAWYFPVVLDSVSPYDQPPLYRPPESWRSDDRRTFANAAWVRYVLLSLLIVTPFARAGFLWYRGGGRIGLERDEETGRLVGLRIVHPVRRWRGGPLLWPPGFGEEDIDHQRGLRKMTEEEVMALPEIVYGGGEGGGVQDADLEEGSSTSDEERDEKRTETAAVLNSSSSSMQQMSSASQDSGTRMCADARTSGSDDASGGIPSDPSTGDSRHASHAATTCTSCSICIDDFSTGEKLRLLPRCGHAFHTNCILPWLTERSASCPLCKRAVLGEEEEEDVDGDYAEDVGATERSEEGADTQSQSRPLTSTYEERSVHSAASFDNDGLFVQQDREERSAHSASISFNGDAASFPGLQVMDNPCQDQGGEFETNSSNSNSAASGGTGDGEHQEELRPDDAKKAQCHGDGLRRDDAVDAGVCEGELEAEIDTGPESPSRDSSCCGSDIEDSGGNSEREDEKDDMDMLSTADKS